MTTTEIALSTGSADTTLILDRVEFSVTPAQLTLLDLLKSIGAEIELRIWPVQRQEGLLPAITLGDIRFDLIDLLCAPATRAAIEFHGVSGHRDYRPQTLSIFGVGSPAPETIHCLLVAVKKATSSHLPAEEQGSVMELVEAALSVIAAEREAARQAQGGGR
ncbi:hypothetical protein [Rhizobium sp. G21]|uniref:hypothetical protein n=1 Tax=Rhizobium sp. G21 TaxID=2758439 RepID=UPI0016040C37|nr:hypothetical protein [Rhizobium sp. G21]MBB1249211.1 hypothetical protein [Rhizobium sp. G21]